MRFALALGLLLAPTLTASPPPQTVLWCWYESCDLRFAPEHGVAFLAAGLYLRDDSTIAIKHRTSPVHIAKTGYSMAVVRVDFDEANKFPASQRTKLASIIVDLQRITRTSGLQIDFDAPVRARVFYRELLREVRKGVGPNVFLSITALVSWCERESWLKGLPVDEVVPMAFRMGQPSAAVVSKLLAGEPLDEPLCRTSIGMSSAETVYPAPNRRIYWFADRARWTPQLLESLIQRYRK